MCVRMFGRAHERTLTHKQYTFRPKPWAKSNHNLLPTQDFHSISTSHESVKWHHALLIQTLQNDLLLCWLAHCYRSNGQMFWIVSCAFSSLWFWPDDEKKNTFCWQKDVPLFSYDTALVVAFHLRLFFALINESIGRVADISDKVSWKFLIFWISIFAARRLKTRVIN